ncbi:hypothetical protein B0H14DRAFT_2597656 [Mycena olivaceomarginata]|nr:hypothetical protein B0H14DRAFT_2597656 [Mycena olivaceomarginata]
MSKLRRWLICLFLKTPANSARPFLKLQGMKMSGSRTRAAQGPSPLLCTVSPVCTTAPALDRLPVARAAADAKACHRRHDLTHIPPSGIVHTQAQDPWLAWWRLYTGQLMQHEVGQGFKGN